MKTLNVLTSACRYCRYYQPEGRRGGTCQLLGGAVHGSWKACALAIPTFAPSWEGLEEKMHFPAATLASSSYSSVACTLDNSSIPANQAVVASKPERTKGELALV